MHSAYGQQPLLFDPLESRMMLAGNVNAFLQGDNLIVRGDGEANELQINAFDDDIIVVEGLNGTTINGNDRAVFEVDDLDNIDIRTRDGADKVFIQNASREELELDGSLIFRGGKRGDDLEIGKLGEVEIEGGIDARGNGGGDNFLLFGKVDVDGLAAFRGGAGNDDFEFEGGEYGTLLVLGQAGNDDVELTGVKVEDGLATLRGNGNGGAGDELELVGNDFEEGLVFNGFEDIDV